MFTNHVNVCVYSVSLSCLIICDPTDCSLSGSSVHGIFQARILEWVAISSSKESSQPRDGTHISCFSCIAGRFFTTEPHQGSPAMYIYIAISIYLPTYLPTYLPIIQIIQLSASVVSYIGVLASSPCFSVITLHSATGRNLFLLFAIHLPSCSIPICMYSSFRVGNLYPVGCNFTNQKTVLMYNFFCI